MDQSSFDSALLDLALSEQLRGRLNEAARLYTKVLQSDPANFNALHMLGVVNLQLGQPLRSVELLLEAMQFNSQPPPRFKHNLGTSTLYLAAMNDYPIYLIPDMDENYDLNWQISDAVTKSSDRYESLDSSVTIIVPVYNHEKFITEALQSVYQQSYRNIDLVLIDDGSTDSSRAKVASALGACPFRFQFIERESNRGSVATLNEALSLANGDYITFLNSDDRYHPDRIRTMLSVLKETKAEWGFSDVGFINPSGDEIPLGQHKYIDTLRGELSLVGRYGMLKNVFPFFNAAISSGNLILRRSLFSRIGKFHNYVYNHDWDLCLRACSISEPVRIDLPLYRYRWHGENTIVSAGNDAKNEADHILRLALAGTHPWHLCPEKSLAWSILIRRGGAVLPLPTVLQMAEMQMEIAQKQKIQGCRLSSQRRQRIEELMSSCSVEV